MIVYTNQKQVHRKQICDYQREEETSQGYEINTCKHLNVKQINNKDLQLPGDSDSKESDCNEGDTGSDPGLGGFPGEENGNPSQYSCLENLMDRGAWWATVHRVSKSLTLLSN